MIDEQKAKKGLKPHQKYYMAVLQYLNSIYTVIFQEYRHFYSQLFTVQCSKCDYCFYYTYHTFDIENCPNCNNEICKYCLEEMNKEHDQLRCKKRYILFYFFGLIAYMALYLKFILMCYSNSVTRYSILTILVVEYLMFYNEQDNFLFKCINAKNILIAIFLLINYNEKELVHYIFLGLVQMIFIVFINTASNSFQKALSKFKGKKKKYKIKKEKLI